VLSALLASAPAEGQTAAPRGELDIERLRELHYTEQQEVRLVQVPAVVTTKRGRIVQGLDRADFRLLEDYVPQEIKYFGTEGDQPIAIAFLLDVSGSMRQAGKLDEAKEAIRFFADSLGADDRLGLVCFADDQVAWVTEFTSARARFVSRLAVQEAYGRTALIDAIAATPGLVEASVAGSRAIVLFTDGIDTASRLGQFEALQLARRVDVPIYAVGFATLASKLRPAGSKKPSERLIEMFTGETGGRLFTVYDPDDLKEAVQTIQQELRFRYVIGYQPTRQQWDGAFRRIKLETVGRTLRVRARHGYYAEP
jgi:Ca-activated chloride channel family protein